ncbi:hypothetical protein Pmi06nite_61730 [Planotetraspora mira]|uniref:Uncharacterized protein n=1 Tax=Planotetraspora mira TaxID=58121 RepID=A0A8J3TV90_9ACTN|nr:hypothetical protein Pmi06nite_61730 [Planotetraspora mira]
MVVVLRPDTMNPVGAYLLAWRRGAEGWEAGVTWTQIFTPTNSAPYTHVDTAWVPAPLMSEVRGQDYSKVPRLS